MSPWDTAARWINAILLVIVGFIGFDTLFRLLEANEDNVLVGFTRSTATIFLGPFEGMFDDQEYLLTALIAVLGYALVAGVTLAILRAGQASLRRRSAARTPGGAPSAGAATVAVRPRESRVVRKAPAGERQPKPPPVPPQEGTAAAAAGSDADATGELDDPDTPGR